MHFTHLIFGKLKIFEVIQYFLQICMHGYPCPLSIQLYEIKKG
jgi:hypothetical protein